MSEESGIVKHYGSVKTDHKVNKNSRDMNNNHVPFKSTNPFESIVEQNLVICGRNLNMTSSQLISASMLSIYFFLTWAYFSLFTPFFPGEALKKGQNRSQIGIIFGMLQLVLLVLSPFFGKYVSK